MSNMFLQDIFALSIFGQMQRNSVKVNKLIKLKKLQIADFVFVLGCVCSTRIQKIVIITIIAKDR
jgi:hypothetical protein